MLCHGTQYRNYCKTMSRLCPKSGGWCPKSGEWRPKSYGGCPNWYGMKEEKIPVMDINLVNDISRLFELSGLNESAETAMSGICLGFLLFSIQQLRNGGKVAGM